VTVHCDEFWDTVSKRKCENRGLSVLRYFKGRYSSWRSPTAEGH